MTSSSIAALGSDCEFAGPFFCHVAALGQQKATAACPTPTLSPSLVTPREHRARVVAWMTTLIARRPQENDLRPVFYNLVEMFIPGRLISLIISNLSWEERRAVGLCKFSASIRSDFLWDLK